jgi:hypothetical protein
MEINDIGTVADPVFWSVSMTLDTRDYTGSRDGLNQIGFGAIQGWSSAELVGVTDPLGNDLLGDWGIAVSDSVNAGAGGPCDTDTGHFKICVSGYSDVSTDLGKYKYTWNFEVKGGDVMGTGDWHWGGQYADGPGLTRGQLISTVSTPIPEPRAALVFAIGFGVIALGKSKR